MRELFMNVRPASEYSVSSTETCLEKAPWRLPPPSLSSPPPSPGPDVSPGEALWRVRPLGPPPVRHHFGIQVAIYNFEPFDTLDLN